MSSFCAARVGRSAGISVAPSRCQSLLCEENGRLLPQSTDPRRWDPAYRDDRARENSVRPRLGFSRETESRILVLDRRRRL